MPDLKLQPQMTPLSLRGRSIYGVLRKFGLRCYWEGVIRRSIARDAQGQCQICGVGRKSVYERVSHFDQKLPWASCHEVWKYDKRKKTATIVDLKLICRRCNLSLHIGIAASRFLGEHNTDAWDEIISHIARVNGIAVTDAGSIVEKVLNRDMFFDEIEWKPTISSKLQDRFPALQLIDL